MLFKNNYVYFVKIINKIMFYLMVFLIGSIFGYYWAYNSLIKYIE